jgi:hypothetical protein
VERGREGCLLVAPRAIQQGVSCVFVKSKIKIAGSELHDYCGGLGLGVDAVLMLWSRQRRKCADTRVVTIAAELKLLPFLSPRRQPLSKGKPTAKTDNSHDIAPVALCIALGPLKCPWRQTPQISERILTQLRVTYRAGPGNQVSRLVRAKRFGGRRFY